MAYTDMDPANIISGQPVSKSTFGDVVIANFDQHEIDINALETTVNAAGSTAAGNAALSTRLGTQITTTNTVTAHLGTGVGVGANVTTGSATSQLTDLRSRVATIEGMANGAWMAANSTQDITVDTFGGSSSNDLLYATAVGTPVGLTMSAGSGVVTVSAGHGGWYHISARFDINASVAQAHQVNLSIQNSANSISYGADTAYYPSSAWTVNTAHALVLLAPGDTFKANLGVFSANGADYADANTGPGTARTHLKAVRIL